MGMIWMGLKGILMEIFSCPPKKTTFPNMSKLNQLPLYNKLVKKRNFFNNNNSNNNLKFFFWAIRENSRKYINLKKKIKNTNNTHTYTKTIYLLQIFFFFFFFFYFLII